MNPDLADPWWMLARAHDAKRQTLVQLVEPGAMRKVNPPGAVSPRPGEHRKE